MIASSVSVRPYALCFVDIPDPSGSYISSSSSSMGFIELQGKEPDGYFQFMLSLCLMFGHGSLYLVLLAAGGCLSDFNWARQ